VMPVIMQRDLRELLEKRIIVFYTGITRSASDILREQSHASATDKQKQAALKRMVELCYVMRDELSEGNVDSFGHILDENWSLKKTLSSGITSPDINHWYAQAMGAGALGGKLLGAGQGGFMMFYAPCERHEDIANAVGLRRVQFGFEPLGSRILFYHPR